MLHNNTRNHLTVYKQMSSGLFKNFGYKLYIYIYIYIYSVNAYISVYMHIYIYIYIYIYNRI